MKGGEGQACRVQHANMWQHCSLAAVQGKNTPVADSILVSHQTDLFSFATHGDECVYSANIIYIIIYIYIYKAICVSLWLRKQQPRSAQGQPKGYFEAKVFELLFLLNCPNERRVVKAAYAEV